jgi:hypothetical protein
MHAIPHAALDEMEVLQARGFRDRIKDCLEHGHVIGDTLDADLPVPGAAAIEDVRNSRMRRDYRLQGETVRQVGRGVMHLFVGYLARRVPANANDFPLRFFGKDFDQTLGGGSVAAIGHVSGSGNGDTRLRYEALI